ncbi:ATP-binding cassette sub-family G member 5-like [Physella acuta]|uniref:ATP-binding cassette sub-family G member 5-like n=1 Tax=Physella acuta TaxID=109671 RepID=UPI0027DD2595|nr:ATP-binding cassette sub-family G member 5-like [Physella acuta]
MDTDKQTLLSKDEASSSRDFEKANGRYGSFGNESDAEIYPKSGVQSPGSPNGAHVTLRSPRSGQLTPGLGSPTTPTSPVVFGQCSPETTLNVIGLSYTVKEKVGHWWNGSCLRKARKKHVLNNLCMSFASGELTALVGSSGSGKTSLLDVISGRAQGDVTGVVTYKQEQCTRDTMMQKASYVLQADRLLPTLTVRETLTYMAYLKLPGYTTESEIEAKVESVIRDMGLTHVADNRIGGAVIRGVSGGEKRRITIGVQLLKDPDILLLDEPTSGLDSFTARHLVASLADIAHKGKLVIMSIHQPRSDIFNLLDKVAILTVGQLAFLGRPNQIVPYFTNIGYPCPNNQNPCDVYIDVTSVDRRTPSQEKKTLSRAHKLCAAFANSDLQTGILKRITSGLARPYSEVYDELEEAGVDDRPSWSRTFTCLLTRMNVHLWRDRSAFLGRFLLLPFFVPFILMFLGKLGYNQGSIQDRLGVIYQATQVPPYLGIVNGIALFPVLRSLFYRECYDGLYSTFTFLAAYYVHCLPFNIICSTIFSAALYWIAGMNDDLVRFGSFILVCVMLTQFGEMMTVGVLGVFWNSQLANNTTALIMSASGLVASGVLRTVENMPQVLQWAGFVAIHKYSTEIIVGNEFQGLKFECDSKQTDQACIETGNDFIKLYYPNALDNMTRNFILMGAYSVGAFIFAFTLFKIRGLPTLH